MDTAKHNSKPDCVTDIVPDGDVVLIVGGDDVRLRVHSQCLRSASQVFGAMFGPNWSEGQRLSRESPTEVPLPEDDADAMRTICYVIHHRNDLVPQHLPAKEVLQIAIEVDKYELVIALKFASLEWLKPQASAERVEMGHLLAAVFLFDNTDLFMANILTLILHYDGSYLDFLDDEFTSQIIPLRIFYLLEERRTKLRAELCQLLIRGKRGNCKCGWGNTRSEKYGLLLVEYMPIKMLKVPIAEVITKMTQVSTEDMERKYSLRYSETLLGKLDALKREASICIDCVRSTGAADV
ncbi:uncharacterized protein BDZ99DRAFT_489516 [Mytilinidion resinicola]|uniref:BTB domain-containing protein n=1 Tax=Mytilinidion resinicola TaxID=574789 RepID=A0A6A6YGQ8_9PEZI|nr:uncharacterized protein BDZ99DRAFT_489516 [Mytilinidion resinicola]KAF2807992.1 hypothetical protein BDZ99DRAFT_489516 [Mytilinidion resinicola]